MKPWDAEVSARDEVVRAMRRERRLVELRAQHRRSRRSFWIALVAMTVFGFYLGLEAIRGEWGWVVLFSFLSLASLIAATLAHDTRKDAERRLGNLGETP